MNNNIKIKVTGKNINNYLKRIIKMNINIIKLINVSYKEIIIIIPYKDYLKLRKYKTMYEIEILDIYGYLKIKEILRVNYILFIIIGVGIGLLLFLSNIIFNVEVIHANKDIRKLLYNELEYYNIKKYTLKKNYNLLEEIEDKILESNKDKLEWIEIVNIGTKYIVRVEERIINKDNSTNIINNVVSSKNAIITMIKAKTGEKVKKVNDYVTKGEVIISSNVTKPSGEVIVNNAEGTIYGEVWYEVSITYPFVYTEERLTGNVKKVLSINFLNKKFNFMNFNKYKNFSRNSKILYQNDIIPFTITSDKLYEKEIEENIYTDEELNIEAINYVKIKMLEKNDKIIEFKNIVIEKVDAYTDYKKLKLFISLIEDITSYSEVINE